VLDHVPRHTHAFVMRWSGEQVPAVSNAHGDDQLIHVGLLNARLPPCAYWYACTCVCVHTRTLSRRVTEASNYGRLRVGDSATFLRFNFLASSRKRSITYRRRWNDGDIEYVLCAYYSFDRQKQISMR
jgi:hypothetical protein